MAYAAQLGALTEELVEVVVSISPQSDPKRFDILKESTLRKIRHHSFLRTNQFLVTNELDGLEERFRVLNRDGLAGELRGRLDALAQLPNKWTPDILHFLLQLSDQPVQNSKLRDLELLRTLDEESEPPLKWDDIAKEEGWDQDQDLWQSVDFADDSSDEKHILAFDAELSNLEAQFVDIEEDVLVSLIKILNEVKPHLQPLSSLSDIIQGLNQAKYPHPFHYLELLFNATNIAHVEGDEITYKFLGAVFFECFRVYVRPIRLWMESGELIEGDKTFFISKSTTQVRTSQVWKHQFKLRKTTNGTLHAPRFLHPATNKIFTTGKSIVVLKRMGRQMITKSRTQLQEPPLEFDEAFACGPGALTTFSKIFNTAFGNWMQSKHHAASSTLRQALFESYGLWSVLDDLQHIYLMCNGAQSDTFASAIFSNIDILNSQWHDRFTVTEVAREAYATVDANRISCILDVLDLTIRLEDARHAESERAEEMNEISRLSMTAASMTASPKRPRRGRYIQPSEEEDETFLAEQDTSVLLQDVDKNYAELLAEIGADFDRLLKFMCGGLRGVARASSNAAATKWDTLAEMLETGIQERQVFSTQSYI
ncbi:putative spc97 spc98 family protein [Eutypa lata UCREL1]|uniref:Spindle pole body component n=1 Tax=Eutypa lata (strain UCR-EL1) TaxID=1287681 RepID=M7ST70_EUTLA|nr:putative spc97 spc98 family protein [Eutypa lata UCREL1]